MTKRLSTPYLLTLLVSLAAAAHLGSQTVSFEPAECEPSSVYVGDEQPIGGNCLPQVQQTHRFGVPATNIRIPAQCTDSSILAVPLKPHMIIVPQVVTQPEIWLHFGGTGPGAVSGNPTNSQNIGTAAASLGYRFISLAYPNRQSVASRCHCDGLGPRAVDCSGVVRAALLYGLDGDPYFEMAPQESITHRLRRLLMWLHERDPEGGWDEFLTEENEPVWSRFAVSGFSQGGGMAGMLSRDKPLARALFFSKGADSVATVELDPGAAVPCSAHSECSSNRCCSLADPGCGEPPPDAICLIPTPAPWALQGRDLSGDGVGEGDDSQRAVPGSRQFAIVHRCEDAWRSSPAVFDLWGMGAQSRFAKAENGVTEVSPGRLFYTLLQPNNCSAHQSMAVDACQHKQPNGMPTLYEVWRLMMSSDWVGGDRFELGEIEDCPVPF